MATCTPSELMKALPERVKIGPHYWAIQLKSNLGEAILGDCSTRKLLIRLWSKLPSNEMVVGTFLHECYHAGLYSFSIGSHLDNIETCEERYVLGCELLNASLFIDNPWLTKWIEKGLYT